MTCVIVANKYRYKDMAKRLEISTRQKMVFISEEHQLSWETLQQYEPEYVFFPHWSTIIPAEIYENYECVVFHMTDLPFGRGGSPLQNLIAQGVYETMLTAFRCQAELDSGPIYLKRPLSLWGTAEEIYMRAAAIEEEMILWIINNRPQALAQQGKPVFFPRRKPEDSNIAELETLAQLFDYIRMLDADTYPPAFLEAGNFRFEFDRASFKADYIKADVRIKLRKT